VHCTYRRHQPHVNTSVCLRSVWWPVKVKPQILVNWRLVSLNEVKLEKNNVKLFHELMNNLVHDSNFRFWNHLNSPLGPRIWLETDFFVKFYWVVHKILEHPKSNPAIVKTHTLIESVRQSRCHASPSLPAEKVRSEVRRQNHKTCIKSQTWGQHLGPRQVWRDQTHPKSTHFQNYLTRSRWGPTMNDFPETGRTRSGSRPVTNSDLSLFEVWLLM
jgi:hypothetical protein